MLVLLYFFCNPFHKPAFSFRFADQQKNRWSISLVLIFLLLLPKNSNFHVKLSYENQVISPRTSAINIINPSSGTVVNLTESSQLRVTWNTNGITGSQILLYKGGEIVAGWSGPYLCFSDPCSYDIFGL